MDFNEILEILKECANFELERLEKGDLFGYGSINNFLECRNMDSYNYLNIWYPEKREKLESLPWTKVVEDPRMPKPEEYPKENGEYITMMDCNEHEICTNTFKDGNFSWMNRTHIKWWMPLLKTNKE